MSTKIFVNKLTGDFHRTPVMDSPIFAFLNNQDFEKHLTSLSWIGPGSSFGVEHSSFIKEIPLILNKIYKSVSDTIADSAIDEAIPMDGFYSKTANTIFVRIRTAYKKNKVKKTDDEIFNHLKTAFFDCFSKSYDFVISEPSRDAETLEFAQKLKPNHIYALNTFPGLEKKEYFYSTDLLLGNSPEPFYAPSRFESVYNTKHLLEDLNLIQDMKRKGAKVSKKPEIWVKKHRGELVTLRPYIPEIDPTFNMDRRIYRDFIEDFVTPGFKIQLLTGNPGVGKSELVQQVCARLKRPLIRVDFSSETTASQFLWDKNYNKETMRLEIEEGILPLCVRWGITCCIEEFSAIPPSVAFELHRPFEEGDLFIKDTGEHIARNNMFSFVLTDNRIGNPNAAKFHGTNRQNSALLNRIDTCYWVDYPELDFEKDYLIKKFEVLDDLVFVNDTGGLITKKSVVEEFLGLAMTTRMKYDSQELGFCISPRTVVKFFKEFFRKGDLWKSFLYTVVNFNKAKIQDNEVLTKSFRDIFGTNPEVVLGSTVQEQMSLNDFSANFNSDSYKSFKRK